MQKSSTNVPESPGTLGDAELEAARGRNKALRDKNLLNHRIVVLSDTLATELLRPMPHRGPLITLSPVASPSVFREGCNLLHPERRIQNGVPESGVAKDQNEDCMS
jgi:hypothetical protein